MKACVATAPTPVLMCGTIAPTAKKRVATTMPMRPVGSSLAIIDQVTPALQSALLQTTPSRVAGQSALEMKGNAAALGRLAARGRHAVLGLLPQVRVAGELVEGAIG